MARGVAERKEGVGGANDASKLLKGENEKGGKEEGKGEEEGGDGVFPLVVELMVERAR